MWGFGQSTLQALRVEGGSPESILLRPVRLMLHVLESRLPGSAG